MDRFACNRKKFRIRFIMVTFSRTQVSLGGKPVISAYRETGPLPSRVEGPRFSLVSRRAPPTKEPVSFLEKRIRDLNISTSFVSSAGSGDSSGDSPDSRPSPTDVKHRTLSRVDSCMSLRANVEGEPSSPPSPIVPTVCEPLHKPISAAHERRQSVLESIGDMMDRTLLSDEEGTEAIGMAMKNDNTFELMLCLLKSRKTVDAQSAFLKMWLRSQRPMAAPKLPQPLHAPYRTISDEPDMVRPKAVNAVRLVSQPAASPPLMPIALQFGDGSSPCESPNACEGRGPTPSILMSNPPSAILKGVSRTPPRESRWRSSGHRAPKHRIVESNN